MTNPVQTYFEELRSIHLTGAGTDETSYYGPLANLLNGISKAAKLKVQCVINLRNQGAGLPDGGFFTTDQIKRGVTPDTVFDQIPSRGAMEVKSTRENVEQIAGSKQVRDYLQRYGLVLVTNYRDFLLVQRGENNEPRFLEGYTIAETETQFWSAVNHPRAMADKHEERLTQFLIRVMLQNAPLTEPKDLAGLLASYAREARERVEEASELDALQTLRTALEEALGVKFEGEKGDHFFRSTLVQTLFYGLFSAWVLWAPDRKERFNWHEAAWLLHVPMINALFSQLATRDRLGPLGLEEVMDWAADALNRVDKDVFFAKFEQEHAVQYFYEPFLEAFDPELRKELGVWYTPPEVVKYMVERVDTVLREELDIADGLADPNVYVLDPCCGTGAYLVEVLRRIERTLRDKGEDALVGSDVKKAATTRVFGFEIMPAPFVVAHLQLGLALKNLRAPLSDEANERAGVYLTNALTGWEPPKEPKTHLPFHEMEIERDLADGVKRDVPILVILGNPPYNGYAGIAIDEERGLTDAYRTTKQAIAPQGQGLNDLYVRFFRMAERRITECTGKGVVCFISNYSWLEGLSFTGMRERYLEAFDRIWIDCLNGDKYKTGKLTPEGKPDPSIFSTEWSREGIQVGTAIALLARKESSAGAEAIRLRHLWGTGKRAELVDTAVHVDANLYVEVQPVPELGLPFTAATSGKTYFTWPLLPALFPVSYPGVKTSRDEFVVDIDRDRLLRRLEQYFDPSISHEEMRSIAPRAMEDAARFDAVPVRNQLLRRGFLPQNIVRYCYRPFDLRWLYWEPETKLLDEKRADYFAQLFDGNVWMGAAQKLRRAFDSPFVSPHIASLHLVERGANLFPLRLRPAQHDLAPAGQHPAQEKWNLSLEVQAYTANVGCVDDAEWLFYHTVTVLHSRSYCVENGDALLQDWPRIPLPNSREALLDSAELGRKIAALLDTETDVPGVTSGKIRPELRDIAVITSVGGKQLNPDAGDLEIKAGWGHGGKDGVTMPGKGKIEPLGNDALNIYLNDKAYWRNIPRKVWDYHIGGYQVIKKWLSYRESDLLGRSLKRDEVQEVTNMARRIAAILALEPDLDANYERVKADTYAWPGKGMTSP